MKDFKIKVTPEQSEVLQKLLFIVGYKWCDGTTDVLYTEVPYLFFDDDKIITYTHSEEYFYNDELPEITFDDLINEIEIELNGRFQN